MQKEYKGSCLCAEVSFSVTDFSERVANCHCTMCRKFHGAAFGTLVSVMNLKWLSGKHLLKDFVASNGTVRTFCRLCGSSIGFRCKGLPLDDIELAISTFNSDIPVTVEAQIHVENKANWYELIDNIPSFKNNRET